MSNHLAIATVTASLRRMVQGVVSADVSGATVTTVRPTESGAGLPQTGVNIFLYQVVPNPDLRNLDLPTRRADGSVLQRPVAALDLFYLFSFYGDQSTLESQRLLGAVVRINIGQIDVRMPPSPPPAPRPAARAAGPRLTLADYLKARQERRR